MGKTNTRKRIAFLVAVLLAVAIFAGFASPAEAAGVPTKIIVFTDKKVYTDWTINSGKSGGAAPALKGVSAKDLKVWVFAVVLDDDGNIMKGRASSISGSLNFTRRLDHYHKSNNSYHHNDTAFNPATFGWSNFGLVFKDDATITGDTANDGVYTAMADLIEIDTTSGGNLIDDHIKINITVKDSGISGGSGTQMINALLSALRCHQTADPTSHSTHTGADGTTSLCTACHPGQEHFFEDISGTIPNDQLDVHFGRMNPPAIYSDSSGKGYGDFVWNGSYISTGGGVDGVEWESVVPGSRYCAACHFTSGNLVDYGAGDRTNLNDRPSCGAASVTQNTASGYTAQTIGCHATGEIEGAAILGWSQAAATTTHASNFDVYKSKAHNHSTSVPANVSCAICHGTPSHGLTMPNMSADISSSGSISDQCITCHNITGGLNITANGGTNVAHDGKTNCKNCHIENNKLDTHLVPTGVFGGKWCLNCHNLTGKSPANMKVDPAIVNISNTDYIHYRLNDNSDAPNASRICWGCHTNNSYVVNGRVNSSSLPASEHPGGYTTPRNCTLCHYNTSAYNFSAPQNYRHTWYSSNMNTPAVSSCTDCHAKDEMLNTWNQSVYPPKNNSEAASHYGKNRTSFFEPLVGKREYCAYCHQNESTVMGPFANPDNKVRSDHASQVTTPGCGNSTCHKPGRMHDDTLVVPGFTEANITSTCQASGCHSSSNYSNHNSTLTCWDCHMGNVSNTSAVWIHPIQFIQYNGNFTGAKLTGATCYDCHKSTSVDSTMQNLSGKEAPKVYNQAHSNDPNNGTKWGDYWKYTPTTYEFATYYVGSGDVNPAYPFENIRVPSNDYMELIENQTGSANDPVTFPYTIAERKIDGPPVPNWTSSTLVTAGTTTLKAEQDATAGNSPGSLKASLTTSSNSGTGTVSWNYSFYYKPDTGQYASTNISADYRITVSTALTQTVYLRLIKPSGVAVTLASASSSSSTGWLTLTNSSFGSVLNEDGSSTPYKIQLYTELSGAKPTSNVYTVNYDNILLKFQEKVWNRYDIVINTTGVPVNGSSKLGLSYQVHQENASLMIYNSTSKAYEPLDTLYSGVFFDYAKEINSTHHINSTDGITGNVSVRFVDTDPSDTDATSDKLHIRYLYVYTDRGLQYPCEQCHSPNKHYVFPTIGSPDVFKANNAYNQTISSSGTWCQQCHWQGADNYSEMIQEFSVTRNPPENIPPEITGNATYAPLGGATDGTPYYDHTGLDMDDLSCFSCHGEAGDTTSSQFVHNVRVGASGGVNCTACHDIGGSKNNVNFTAVNMGMHAGLNEDASFTGGNATNRPCWGCHGTKSGSYANESDQPSDNHNATYYKNPRKCYDCHITGSLNFTTRNVTDHIPSGYYAGTDVNTSSYNYTYCSYCHNNSVSSGYEPDAMGLTGSSSPMNASVSHYGANRTANKLMAQGINSTDCVYCHSNSSNMLKWGILQGSLANISNKNASGGGTNHDSYTSSDQCSTCHGGYSAAGFTFHSAAVGNGSGGGSGPDCKSCHDIGGSVTGKLVNFSAMNDTSAIHRNLNSGATADVNAGNKKCWACHGDGSQPSSHPANYKTPYTCTDCHNQSGSQSATYPGWNVTEHVRAGTVSGTELFTPLASNCYACHNRSEMMMPANDPDSGSGEIYGGANAGNNSTSHYGLKRDLGSGDAYCNYCHNNASSIFYLSSSNKSIIEHTANTSANISNATALECLDCHSTGRIHNDTLAKPSTQVWTSGKQDYCAPCHKAGDAGATKYVYGHNTSNLSISSDCGYCHNASAQGSIGGALRIHASTLTNRSTSNTTCVSCHQDAAYVTNQRVIYTHYPGAPSGKANTSLDSYTCEACHGNMAADKMHAPVSVPADRCNNCHNGTASGTYKATGIPYVNATRHDNASHNASNSINCDWCHNNSNSIQKFHFTQYPNGSVQAPGWSGWSNGTNANCTNCHDTYNQTKPFYAEPVWHNGNYGTALDNCYQCHTNVSSNASGYAPVALHNVTKAIDWSTCNNCHSSGYGGAPMVDNASLAGSMHYSLNGSTASNTEPACKACHGGNATTHKNASTNNCTYCHITGSEKYSAKNVSRHIPYPYTTDVNTSRYQSVFCADCHNNSLRTFNDATPGGSNATTAHYGMNKTAGKLMYNTSGNSEDCTYCHRNSSNMAAWGILSTGNANLSKKGSNHATASNADCYTCHVNSTTMPATFHVEEINAGAGGGPDCKACHDIGGNAQGKLVNFSAMNDGNAIHKNLNSGASDTTSSPENRACWACHTANGTQPQAGNHTLVDRYKTPYNCTDCHISKSGQNLNYTPKAVLNVTQHKADTINGTTIFTPLAYDCYSCHNKSEMMTQANDPDSGTGAVYNGLHGGNDSVSHYGLKRNDLGGYSQNTDGYCNYCHNNASSPFYLSTNNKSIIEHTTNTSANISNASTLRCIDCHRTGRIHNASLNKTPQSAWTSGQKDYCAPCHEPKPTGQANKSVYLQGHDPTYSSTDAIGDCGFCHNSSSRGMNGSYLNVHSSTLTNRSTIVNSFTCQGCHNGTTLYVGAEKRILSHMPNASEYRGNTSTSGYTCELCHNMTDKPSMHSAGMSRSNGTCETCHLNSTSPYNSTVKKLPQLAGGMLNHSYNGSANTTCRMCHNASGRAEFHLSEYASGDVADPQDESGTPTFENRSTWNSDDSNNRGILVDCRDCHEKYNDTAPFFAPYFEANITGVNAQEHVGKGYILKNCYICHTNETISVSGDTVVKPVALHNATIEPLTGGPNCTKCHNIGATDPGKAPDSMLVNFTAFNGTDSKHRNLTNTTEWGGSAVFGLIDTACWACHQSDGKQMERHPDLKDDTTLTGGSKAYGCADCHTVGGVVSSYQPSVYQNATKVYKHYPGAIFTGAKKHSSNFTQGSCQVCHNNSLVFSNISAGLNATVSHYLSKLDLKQTDLVKSCEGCHYASTTYGMPKQLLNNITHSMGQACQVTCHNPDYINLSYAYPKILHNASIGIYFSGCYLEGCHVQPARQGRGGNR